MPPCLLSKTSAATPYGQELSLGMELPLLVMVVLRWHLVPQSSSRLHPVGQADFGPELGAYLMNQAVESA
jgi:hypothetical protein